MSPQAIATRTTSSAEEVAARIRALDWNRAWRDLDAAGNAILEGLLSPDECRSLAGLYPSDDLFRSRIVMARHGFGRGEYKYFRYPLPEIVAGGTAAAPTAAALTPALPVAAARACARRPTGTRPGGRRRPPPGGRG